MITTDMSKEQLAEQMLNVKRVAFFFGGGGTGPSNAELQKTVARLAERVSGFVVWSPDTPNHVPRGTPTVAGPFSLGGSPLAKEAMKHAGLVVAIDNHLSGFATQGGKGLAGKRIVYVSAEPLRPGACSPHAWVREDPLTTFRDVARMLEELALREAGLQREQRQVFPMHSRAVLRLLNEELPQKSIIMMDVCMAGLPFAGQELTLGPKQVYRSDVEVNGCMGQMFGESIGARLASPDDVAVVCVMGDGCFRMVANGELHGLADAGPRASYVALVLANGGFQFVGRAARQVVGAESRIPLGEWTRRPDIAMVARGWGAAGHVAASLAELRKHLRRAFSTPGPTVIEVPIDNVFEAPIGDRADEIARMFAK